MDRKVSLAVIRRLPKYYRYLLELSTAGTERISSQALARRMGLTASQIRQDLNCFGGFGQQGYGYNVENLRREVAGILGIDVKRKAVLIGVGNLGTALLNNFDFNLCGFDLVVAFDSYPERVPDSINGVEVRHISGLEEFVKKERPDIAVFTLPTREAPKMALKLQEWGIGGIWNFTNKDLPLSDSVRVENVHFDDSLMTLAYLLGESNRGGV